MFKFVKDGAVKLQPTLEHKDAIEAQGFVLELDEPEEGDVIPEAAKPKRRRKVKK